MRSYLKIPFIGQQKDYYCGVAVVQMILKYYGIMADQEYLATVLKTSIDHGTRNKNIIDILNKYGILCEAKNNSKIEDIFQYLEEGKPVIVNYIEPNNNEGHYSIVIGYTEDRIILNDPWNGQAFTLDIEKFKQRWRDGENKYPNWLLVVYRQ